MEQSLFFKILVLSVLVIIVIFSIVNFIQYRKYQKNKNNIKFPPWPSKCPDYWKVGDDDKCINIHNIGICKTDTGGGEADQTMDFGDTIFKGPRGMYAKCNFSRECKAPWEGIDNVCV